MKLLYLVNIDDIWLSNTTFGYQIRHLVIKYDIWISKTTFGYRRRPKLTSDHGLYEILPSNLRAALCGLWVAVVHDSHSEMKRYLQSGDTKYLLVEFIFKFLF